MKPNLEPLRDKWEAFGAAGAAGGSSQHSREIDQIRERCNALLASLNALSDGLEKVVADLNGVKERVTKLEAQR